MSAGSKPVRYLTNRTVVVSLVLQGDCTKTTRAAELAFCLDVGYEIELKYSG